MSHLAGCFIQGKQSLSHWLAENWTEWPNVIFEPTVTLKILNSPTKSMYFQTQWAIDKLGNQEALVFLIWEQILFLNYKQVVDGSFTREFDNWCNLWN